MQFSCYPVDTIQRLLDRPPCNPLAFSIFHFQAKEVWAPHIQSPMEQLHDKLALQRVVKKYFMTSLSMLKINVSLEDED